MSFAVDPLVCSWSDWLAIAGEELPTMAVKRVCLTSWPDFDLGVDAETVAMGGPLGPQLIADGLHSRWPGVEFELPPLSASVAVKPIPPSLPT